MARQRQILTHENTILTRIEIKNFKFKNDLLNFDGKKKFFAI